MPAFEAALQCDVERSGQSQQAESRRSRQNIGAIHKATQQETVWRYHSHWLGLLLLLVDVGNLWCRGPGMRVSSRALALCFAGVRPDAASRYSVRMVVLRSFPRQRETGRRLRWRRNPDRPKMRVATFDIERCIRVFDSDHPQEADGAIATSMSRRPRHRFLARSGALDDCWLDGNDGTDRHKMPKRQYDRKSEKWQQH